jgi:hypothetical protein
VIPHGQEVSTTIDINVKRPRDIRHAQVKRIVSRNLSGYTVWFMVCTLRYRTLFTEKAFGGKFHIGEQVFEELPYNWFRYMPKSNMPEVRIM